MVKKIKPPFFDWLLLDTTPFWVVTRIGFVGSSIILLLITAYLISQAINVGGGYVFGAILFVIITFLSIKKFALIWKHIKGFENMCIIDNVPNTIRIMNGIHDVEATKEEYREEYLR